MRTSVKTWMVVVAPLLALTGVVCSAQAAGDAAPVAPSAVKPADKVAWMNDFEAAKAKAKETGRAILADFSGSDWCGWCIKLDQEVFSQPAFQTYATENLVLFLADFPRRSKLPETTAKQNEALMERYQVEGFPTVLLLSAKGEVLGRTGYRKGGAAGYVQHLRELESKAPKAVP